MLFDSFQAEFRGSNQKECTMTESSSDETQERVATAIRDADSGSNHQAGMDGDEASAADRTAADDDDDDPPNQ